MDTPAPTGDSAAPISTSPRATPAIDRVLAASRVIMLIPVVGSFVASATLLLYGGVAAFTIVYGLITDIQHANSGDKLLSIEFVNLLDEFLLGAVFYIFAVGFYQLFINRDLHLPGWLETRSLDDLKDKLIRIVVVLLGILFLQQTVRWDGQLAILGFGVAIALVILALSVVLWLHQREVHARA